MQGPLKAATEEEAKALQAVLEALQEAEQASVTLQAAAAALESHRQQHAAELQRLEAAVGTRAPSPLPRARLDVPFKM